MKKTIIILLLCFTFYKVGYSQIDSALMQSIKPIRSYDSKQFYLKKSKSKETVGWTLLAAGAALLIVGIDRSNHPKGWLDLTGEFLIFDGLLCHLISIPFFISSSHHARKAAQF